MRSGTGAAAATGRGRLVMMVDNGVVGDSRVLKSARSAAEAGWDVTVLGVYSGSGPHDFDLGGAKVRLLRVTRRLTHPGRRRRSLAWPLAYPPGSLAGYRFQALRAWQNQVDLRRAMLAQPGAAASPADRYAAQASIATAQAAIKAATLWARLRAGQLTRLEARRQDPRSPSVRFSLWLWEKTLQEDSWRKLDPALWEYELAMGTVIDELQPDLIHAHDFRMIGVGARATLRARAAGRRVAFVYDAHEFVPGIPGRPTDPRWLPAQIAYERRFMPYADAVVTISDTLAELLRETHGLAELPTVVLNAPTAAEVGDGDPRPVPDIREMCRIDATTPLIVYSGGINDVRGLDLMVDAMPHLPGVHMALVSLHPNGRTKAADELRQRAEGLGVADRVHILPYVPHWQVARFLSGGDLAVSALVHLPNHEIALSNKFFEYSRARLPLVVSDVKTMADTVRATGQGEIFRAGDQEDYLRAVRAVLADPQRYRAAYDRPGLLEEWSWETQAAKLDALYSRLLGEVVTRPGPATAPAPASRPAPAADPADIGA